MREQWRRAARPVAMICVVALVCAIFSYFGYGADQPYKVTFYQLSVTSDGIQGNTVSVTYTRLTQFVDAGETAANPGSVEYLGKDGGNQKFIGWYEFNAPSDSPYNFGAPVTGSLKLFARFTNEYLVTFLDGFGDPFLTKLVSPGGVVGEPTDGEMSLFTAPGNKHFDAANGWKDGDGKPYDFSAPVAQDLTLSPSLVNDVSFVYFVSEGSQVPFQTVKAPNNTATAPPAPTREGYTFDHWSLTKGGVSFNWNASITGDTKLYAVWTPTQVEYAIVVWREKKNIAGDPGADPGNYEYISRTTRPAMAGSSMNGQIAGAASLVASFAPQPSWAVYGFAASTSDDVLGNGGTVLNVYYKRVVYKFAFTPYNRNYSATANVTMKIGTVSYTDSNRYRFNAKYEQDVSAVWPSRPLAQFTIPGAGLNFQGWLAPGVTLPFVSKVVSVSADLLPGAGTSQTVTANYITSGMNVNLHYMFESTEGNIPGAVLYKGKYYVQDSAYSQSVFSPGTPFELKEIEGMRKLTSHALQKTTDGFAEVAPGRTLAEQYLFYDRIRYAIDFNEQGGSAIQDIADILPGTPLAPKKPNDPTRAGSEFDGWYSDAGYTAPFDFASATMPGAKIILYAKWKQNPFTVSVYDGFANAVPLGAYTRAQGAYVGDPAAGLADVGIAVNYVAGETYPGKGEFLGWAIPLGPGEKATLSFETPISGDLSVYADWKPQTYTVAYAPGSAASGAPPIDTKDYQSGVSARVLEPYGGAGGGSLVTPGGMTFIGWIDEDGRIHCPGETISVTKNIVLTANYAPPYEVIVYVYHINYPAGALDGDGRPITDPGDLKQYVEPDKDFAVLSYNAYSPTPEPAGYRFAGWATSETGAAAGTVEYEGGKTARAEKASSGNDEYEMWGVWTQYFPVSFDAGDWGVMSSGVSQVTYQVQAGTSLGALGISVPNVEARDDDYAFLGWSPSGNTPVMNDPDISAALVNAPITYKAVYANTPPPISGKYYAVTFDAGGVYGDIAKKESETDTGASNVVYQVKESLSLSASALSVPGVRVTDSDYAFLGWAVEGAWPAVSPAAVISAAEVTGAVTYRAVYTATPDALKEYSYAVTFDSGGVYGKLSDGSTSSAISVRSGTALADVPGFTVPTVQTINPDFAFAGWSPTVNMTSPVNGERLYKAQYAYIPSGSPGSTQVYHMVSFDIGTYGRYDDLPLTSFVVPEGTSLGGLNAINPGSFDADDFSKGNILVPENFQFVGWSPTLDPAAGVYADLVYHARYAYEPPGLSAIVYTNLVVDEEPPGEFTIRALGYEGYYDGDSHGVRYAESDPPGLSNVLSFWFDPSGKGLALSEVVRDPSLSSGGIWAEGLPPKETDVTEEEVRLIFTADGMNPAEVSRKIIIHPRPLVPQATHADMWVGDGVPFRETYGLAIDYDGRKADGTPIGDNFSFVGHEGEFDRDGLQITTTYTQDDPAGDYPIYVKAGVYGNYEIYEGTEGNWPSFPGWRFAGVLHVKAAGGGNTGDTGNSGGDTGDTGKNGGDTGNTGNIGGDTGNAPVADANAGDDPDAGDDDADAAGAEEKKGGGAADTGDDSSPALWTALLIVSLSALLLTSRRMGRADCFLPRSRRDRTGRCSRSRL
jgi:uncharacterized repeat protein (TIGR02543 family)